MKINNKLKVLSVICSLVVFESAYSDNFPLASVQSNEVKVQPMPAPVSSTAPSPTPVTSNNSPTSVKDYNSSVPPIGNVDYVNTGQTLVPVNSGGNSSNIPQNVLNSDLLAKDANALKRYQKLQEEQSKNLKSNNQTILQQNQDVPKVVSPITASMIDYTILNKNRKFATVMFVDKSTIEVQKGSIIGVYKVSNIFPDHIDLYKINKDADGEKYIKLYKNNPVLTNNQNYNTISQTVNMVDTKKY